MRTIAYSLLPLFLCVSLLLQQFNHKLSSEMKVEIKKKDIYVMLFSFLIPFLIFGFSAINSIVGNLAYGIAYGALTYYLLKTSFVQPPRRVISLIIIGILLLEIPMRGFWFMDSIGSIMVPFSKILGCFIGYLLFSKKTKSFAICTFIWLLICIAGEILLIKTITS